MKIQFPAIISHDKRDNRFLVQFPDLPEAITEGENLEEALFNAAEVLTLTLEGRMDEGIKIPKPSHRKSKNLHWVSPSARVQAALLIHIAKEGKHTTAALARTLETSWPAVARLEDPHHWPSLRQLERTASAIGYNLVLSFEQRT